MSESRAQKLPHAKRQRGAAHSSITRMEDNIARLESKGELSSADRLMIRQLLKNMEKWDAKFKHHHYVIRDLIEEDEVALEQEYAIFNDYEDKVTTFSIRLQDLKQSMETPSVPAKNLSLRLNKRLRYIETELRTIDESALSLHPGPTVDIFLLHQLQEQTSSLLLELSEVTRDILSLEGKKIWNCCRKVRE